VYLDRERTIVQDSRPQCPCLGESTSWRRPRYYPSWISPTRTRERSLALDLASLRVCGGRWCRPKLGMFVVYRVPASDARQCPSASLLFSILRPFLRVDVLVVGRKSGRCFRMWGRGSEYVGPGAVCQAPASASTFARALMCPVHHFSRGVDPPVSFLDFLVTLRVVLESSHEAP
jgi:hypothetical protein